VEEVWERIQELGNVILKMAGDMLNGLLKEIQDGVHNWYVGIVEVVKKIGKAKSDEEAMMLGVELFKATFGDILPYVMGLVIGIEAALLVMQGISGGLATLIVPTIAMLVITAFIENANLPQRMGINEDFTIEGLVQWVAGNINGNGGNNNTDSWQRAVWAVGLGGTATVFGLTGTLLGLRELEKQKDISIKTRVGVASSITAGVLGLVGVVLSAASCSPDVVLQLEERRILNLWNAVIGGLGLVFSLIGTALSGNLVLFIANMVFTLFSAYAYLYGMGVL
jgi:hypothetical protein